MIELKVARGAIYFELKQNKNALIDFQDVLLLDPSNLRAHFYVARCLSAGEQNTQSKAQDLMLHLEQIAKSEDEYLSGNAFYLMAKVLTADKRFNEAQAILAGDSLHDIAFEIISFALIFIGVFNMN